MPNSPKDPSDSAEPTGLRKGLTSYGDHGFSLFLRKAFIKGAGYTDAWKATQSDSKSTRHTWRRSRA